MVRTTHTHLHTRKNMEVEIDHGKIVLMSVVDSICRRHDGNGMVQKPTFATTTLATYKAYVLCVILSLLLCIRFLEFTRYI